MEIPGGRISHQALLKPLIFNEFVRLQKYYNAKPKYCQVFISDFFLKTEFYKYFETESFVCMSYSNYEKLLKMKNSTSYKVAKATGIANSTLSDWKKGRSVPKTDKMKLIADYFGVEMERLLGEDVDFAFSEIDDAAGVGSKKMIPIIGEIRAGYPIITNETLLGYESADIGSADERDYFYLMVRGDSMKDCGMVDGSLVLFRKQQYAEEGNIVACLVGDESATVKRFHTEKRRIYLVPENEEYDPIELSPEDFESGSARILGVAIEMKIKF